VWAAVAIATIAAPTSVGHVAELVKRLTGKNGGPI